MRDIPLGQEPVCVIGPAHQPERGIAYYPLGSTEVALRSPYPGDDRRLRTFDVGGQLYTRDQVEWVTDELWRREGLHVDRAAWPNYRTHVVTLAPDGWSLLAELPQPIDGALSDEDRVFYFERPGGGHWNYLPDMDGTPHADLRVPAGLLAERARATARPAALAPRSAREFLLGDDVDAWTRNPGHARRASLTWPTGRAPFTPPGPRVGPGHGLWSPSARPGASGTPRRST